MAAIVIGVGMALFSMGKGGMDMCNHADQLRTNITNLQEKSTTMKKTYNNIINDEETETINIQNYVQKELDDMQQLTADITVANFNHQKAVKQIEIIGMVWVSVIVLLLFLKRIGFFHYMRIFLYGKSK
jgi:hypothetical protein